MEELSTEVSLEDMENAYYYEMFADKYSDINDDQIEVTPPTKSSTGGLCSQAKHNQSCDCWLFWQLLP